MATHQISGQFCREERPLTQPLPCLCALSQVHVVVLLFPLSVCVVTETGYLCVCVCSNRDWLPVCVCSNRDRLPVEDSDTAERQQNSAIDCVIVENASSQKLSHSPPHLSWRRERVWRVGGRGVPLYRGMREGESRAPSLPALRNC